MAQPNDELHRVVRAMLKDFDSIRSEIADQVWAQVPAYSSIPLERQDLQDRVNGNILNVMMCFVENRPPSAADLERVRQNGERRALQGVSQSAIIQSFRQAERTLGDVFQSWSSRMQVKASIARVGRSTMIGYLDMLERAMLDSFSAMELQVKINNAVTEPTLMNRLATGSSIAPGEVEHLAAALGIDGIDNTRFVGLCLAMSDSYDEAELQRIRHHVVFQLGSATGATVLSGSVLTDTGEHVAVFALQWERPLAELTPIVTTAISETVLRPDVRIAIGDPRIGLVQVGSSCRQAMSVLNVMRTTGSQRECLLYRDLLLEVLVRRDPAISREMHERYIGPLASIDFLEETLRTFLSTDLSIGETAELLHVHKNTISYRLKRIYEITGLDLHSVRDIARVVIALEGAPVQRDRGSSAATFNQDPHDSQRL